MVPNKEEDNLDEFDNEDGNEEDAGNEEYLEENKPFLRGV